MADDFDSNFMKLLRSRRSPAGDLYLTRTMADQLFRVMEINERILANKNEIIEGQKWLIQIYRGKANANVNSDDSDGGGSSGEG
jgi:hypothetical protein